MKLDLATLLTLRQSTRREFSKATRIGIMQQHTEDSAGSCNPINAFIKPSIRRSVIYGT